MFKYIVEVTNVLNILLQRNKKEEVKIEHVFIKVMLFIILLCDTQSLVRWWYGDGGEGKSGKF